MIITVDGLSASGKGSLATALGNHFNYPVLDTGSIWRCLAVRLNDYADGPCEALMSDEEIRAEVFNIMTDTEFPLCEMSHKDLRIERTSRTASIISCDQQTRQWVNEMIVNWADRPGGCVIDGRDIGRLVVPHADLKFFLIAEAEDRATWRDKQLHGKNMPTRNGPPEPTEHYPQILAEIKGRDAREIHRSSGASTPADDAMIINASDFRSADEVFDFARKGIKAREDWKRIHKQSGVNM